MRRALFDIETDALDLRDVSVVHSLCLIDLDSGRKMSCTDSATEGSYPSIREGLEVLSRAEWVGGHNALSYDLPVLRKLYPGFDLAPGCVFRDTLVLSRLIHANLKREDIDQRPGLPRKLLGSHSLEAWGYRLLVYKGEFAHQTDWREWSRQMQDYCEQDTVVTRELALKLLAREWSEESIDLEHRVREIIDMQEREGFPVDKPALLRLEEELRREIEQSKATLAAIVPPRVETLDTPAYYLGPSGLFGSRQQFATKGAAKAAGLLVAELEPGPPKQRMHPFNPGSRPQIIAALKARGWEPLKFTDAGNPKVDEDTLAPLAPLHPDLIPPLLEYLLVAKRLGQVASGKNAWLKKIDARSGRIHGRVNTNGAVTGRFTHSDPNMSQVPRVQKGPDKRPLLGKAGGWGWECRAAFTAPAGKRLVGFDASGLELRDLAHYMAPYDGGAYAKVILEGDVHSVNQAAAGLDTRDTAKTFVYAYLYGAGDYKLGLTAGLRPGEIGDLRRHRKRWRRATNANERRNLPTDDYNVALTVKGGLLRERFEENTPALADLKADIAKAVEDRGYLYGLDGRELAVRSPHSALNTLLQSAGAVVMKKATVLFHDTLTVDRGLVFGRDYANVSHSHDEIQAWAEPALAETVGKAGVEAIRAAGRYFKFNIPLDGEFKIGSNWAETH